MKIKVRKAKPRDRGLFLKLYKKFAEDEYKKGSSIPVTKNNIELYGAYFDAFTSGDLDGVILIFRENAFVMYGEIGSAFDYEKKQANSFAIWVDEEYRGKGIAQILRDKAFKYLKEKGFETVIGVNMSNNKKAIESSKVSGFKVVGYMVEKDLEETE